MDLCRVVDELDIPVMTYGLRTDFQLNLFEGSYMLLALADEIRELRGFVIVERKQLPLPVLMQMANLLLMATRLDGAEDKYVSLCRKHYLQLKNNPDTVEA
ncbi:thymidine kinase [Klebsiella phage CPRSA]|nr:thymidine kinase [Klebsiella phage CPRSA]